MSEEPTNAPIAGELRVVKAGMNGTGSQRMKCQDCSRYFTPNPKPMGYDHATREMAVRLYLEGNSFRAIGRLLSVHYVSVINWVNAIQATYLSRWETPPHEIEETDELFTFVGKNKQVYVVVSVARDTRLIGAAAVPGEQR